MKIGKGAGKSMVVVVALLSAMAGATLGVTVMALLQVSHQPDDPGKG
ncbi:MAG: hypothetical protein HFE44_11030 [Oscillospiraceae bacterium]|nr:hypothetical protein [Oscillospiraceae bacterium]